MSDAHRIENLECEAERFRETLYGNGHPGLSARVTTLETKVDEVTDIKRRLARIEYAVYAAIGAIGLAKFIFH